MRGFEEILAERGPRSDAFIAIAVHSTVLGPALGGARLWHYEHTDAAVADAMRLAEAMTHKAAAAGLDLGGGKGVIAAPAEARPEGALRRAILLDFGDLVESLEGRYVTAEDVGTGPADMEVIAERTSSVVGLDSARGGSGDPSPVTALGVLSAMRACASARFGSRELRGLRVVVIGLGHVGTHLAQLLAAEGARLVVTDIDPARQAAAERLGAEWAEPAQALRLRCEILAPCALGGLIDAANAEALDCEVLCGAANNVLAEPAVAEALARAGVLYAPDFIANAGGLISVYGELRGTDHARSLELAAEIEATMDAVIARAERDRVTPLSAARALSEARLRAARRPARAGAASGAGRLAGSRLRHS